eukprot:scaffold5550_cov107-Isochrysis_galbana.AAC.1
MYWLERAASSTSPPAGKAATPGPRQAGRPDGTGRGAFPLVADRSAAHVLVPYSSQDTTEYLSGDVFITQVDGGRRVPFILQPDNFDDGFVRKEGVPGFPSPLEAGRFGPASRS